MDQLQVFLGIGKIEFSLIISLWWVMDLFFVGSFMLIVVQIFVDELMFFIEVLEFFVQVKNFVLLEEENCGRNCGFLLDYDLSLKVVICKVDFEFSDFNNIVIILNWFFVMFLVLLFKFFLCEDSDDEDSLVWYCKVFQFEIRNFEFGVEDDRNWLLLLMVFKFKSVLNFNMVRKDLRFLI